MEKIVETTIMHYIEIMEKNMETTITGYIGFRVQHVHVGAVSFLQSRWPLAPPHSFRVLSLGLGLQASC